MPDKPRYWGNYCVKTHNPIKISPERIGNLEMQDVSNVEEPSETPSNNHIRSISGNLEGREQ